MGDSPELSLDQIQSWNPAPLVAHASDMRGKLATLDGVLDDIKTRTNQHWGETTGTAETARCDHVDAITAYGREKHQLLVQHQQLLEEAAHGLGSKRERLLTEIQAARKAGLDVWPDGSVSGHEPRQTEALQKYVPSIGQLKHDFEQTDADYAQRIRDLNSKIKEGGPPKLHNAGTPTGMRFFGGPGGPMRDDNDPPPQPYKEPVAFDPNVSGVPESPVHRGLNLPPYQPGTLSDEETRVVYAKGELEIARQIDLDRKVGWSEEDVAKHAFDRRNALRTWCRDLMANQDARAELDRKYPNKTWDQLMQEQAAKGRTGDDAYRAITESSVRSRPSVNQSLGVNPEDPGPLPQVRPNPNLPPEPKPEEPGTGGRVRPEPEGGGGGRMRPYVEPPIPLGSIAGQSDQKEE